MKKRILFFLYYTTILNVVETLLTLLHLNINSYKYIKLFFSVLFDDNGMFYFACLVWFYIILFFYKKSKYRLFNPLGKRLYYRQLDKRPHLADVAIVGFLTFCITVVQLGRCELCKKITSEGESRLGENMININISLYDNNTLSCLAWQAAISWFLVCLFFYFYLFQRIYSIRHKMLQKRFKTTYLWIALICYEVISIIISYIYLMYYKTDVL